VQYTKYEQGADGNATVQGLVDNSAPQTVTIKKEQNKKMNVRPDVSIPSVLGKDGTKISSASAQTRSDDSMPRLPL
jgi:hypothetical protein